jgi:hypothetical protein
MATKVAHHEYDDDMEEFHSISADEIIIERREEVGRVQLGNGPGSAITEAFRISGEYISEHLRDGTDNTITVEFGWNGMNFIAKVES